MSLALLTRYTPSTVVFAPTCCQCQNLPEHGCGQSKRQAVCFYLAQKLVTLLGGSDEIATSNS